MVIAKDFDRSLYPYESHFLNCRGHRYHYIDEGEGEPVVMIHGNPTWGFYFRRLVADLRHDYRVIVPDHLGCGLSDKPAASVYGYRLQNRVADLDLLLSRLDPQQKITLIAHDWGGMIGSAWAQKNPKRIQRLIFMNTAGFTKPNAKKLPSSLAFGRDSRLGAALILYGNAFARLATRWAVHHKPLTKPVKKAYLAPYHSPRNRLATLKFVEDIPLGPQDPSYKLVSETEQRLCLLRHVPTLLLWGKKDFVFDEHFLKRWRQLMPQAQYEVFPEAGHYVLEDAYEACLSRIQSFLAAHPGVTP